MKNVMQHSSSALAVLLAGKTPEAMYDALYAGRYLSPKGETSPAEVLTFMKALMRSSRQRSLMPVTLMARMAAALAGSGFLNESDEQLALQKIVDQ